MIIPVCKTLSIPLKLKSVSCASKNLLKNLCENLIDAYKLSHFYLNDFVSECASFSLLS